MRSRPQLMRLAERCGILHSYRGTDGQMHDTPEPTYVALLAAMGYDASSEDSAADAARELERAQAERLIDPVRVLRESSRELEHLPVRLPDGLAGRSLRYRITLRSEHGEPDSWEGRASADSQLLLELPRAHDLPIGYHALALELDVQGRELEAHQTLAVAPPTCLRIEEVLGARRAYGLWAHLYSLRDGRPWGIGDLGTLERLVDWGGRSGADFVGINPLHALPEPLTTLNPYYPSSRLYRAGIYLDIERIPELASSREAQQRHASTAFREAMHRLEQAPRVDASEVAYRKRALLDPLYARFAQLVREQPDSARAHAFTRFVDREGAALEGYATFAAIREHLVARMGPRAMDTRTWPAELRDPAHPEVAEFRRAHAEAIDQQRYIQFELDRQLGGVTGTAQRHGMTLGLYEDLALGNAPDGADVWAFGSLFAHGASVGAPPDPFSMRGQDWGLAPLVPPRMEAEGFAYFRLLAKHAMRHAGTLRIDHVMGLRRQYWVPAGMPPTQGAYVNYPEEALLGIVALESRRAGCVVIGEDLGTVPEGMREALVAQGLLRSQVLYFERDHEGRFLPPGAYSDRALVTVNTHDLPTLAGFWDGSDLERRREAGALGDDQALEAARREREQARRQLLERLAEEGLAVGQDDYDGLLQNVHVLLARTPSPLLGIAVDDLAGEVEELNLPGASTHEHPSWTRRMARPLDAIEADPRAQQVVARVRDERHERG